MSESRSQNTFINHDWFEMKQQYYFDQLSDCFKNLLNTRVFNGDEFVSLALLARDRLDVDIAKDDAVELFLKNCGHIFVLNILPSHFNNQPLQYRSLDFLNSLIDYSRHLQYMKDTVDGADDDLSSRASIRIVEMIDADFVSISMNCAIYAYSEDIQIAALTVLAKLCIISATASTQMLESSFHSFTSSPKFQPGSRLSCLLTIIALKSSNWKLLGYCADLIFALAVDSDVDRANMICASSSCVIPPFATTQLLQEDFKGR